MKKNCETTTELKKKRGNVFIVYKGVDGKEK